MTDQLALVAGALLSAAIEAIIKRLNSGEILDFFLHVKKMQDCFLLKKLEMTLNSLNKVMEDAEERQYSDPYVKRWLDELKHSVFQAEDLLLEIATEASQKKLQLELHPTTECLAKQREELGLKEGPGALTQVGVKRKVFKRMPESSLIDEAHVFGRDADKEKIIKILLSPTKGQNQYPVDVIAIKSMGGMGKTTLARLVYEDKRMTKRFQYRAWVCLSEEFDPVQATKAILKELDCSIQLGRSHDLDPNQRKLQEKLKGKKFFLVLDDVWNRNRAIWEAFRTPFNYGAPGSKILTTTREEEVAKVMQSRYSYFGALTR
ncbi:putative disease resistance RPP13-like protein 1 isoform X2 [Prosopis cineraria]|uniref:putative disease resistance RPP13-like protein 1 isoform X2 n=1 Tax=Prosopis cineraria TaxID=364024 RepID=UPI0024102AD9|nr:putative disease resistance RPP13-like protein 1 isoform X2 [Prosopis cineraria]